MERALAVGDAEGLEAVSLRRIASEFGVTPMAIYRHVRDKDDLHFAMLDATLADAHLTDGIRPSMPWQEQIRRALRNTVKFLTARRVSLPLQIAYSGPLTPRIARTLEDSFELLLRAGFTPRDAAKFARVLPVLLAGLLVLQRDERLAALDERAREKLRRATEAQLLDLPEDEFPLLRRHVKVIAESFLPESDGWVDETIDLLVAALEKARSGGRRSPRGHTRND